MPPWRRRPPPAVHRPPLINKHLSNPAPSPAAAAGSLRTRRARSGTSSGSRCAAGGARRDVQGSGRARGAPEGRGWPHSGMFRQRAGAPAVSGPEAARRLGSPRCRHPRAAGGAEKRGARHAGASRSPPPSPPRPRRAQRRQKLKQQLGLPEDYGVSSSEPEDAGEPPGGGEGGHERVSLWVGRCHESARRPRGNGCTRRLARLPARAAAARQRAPLPRMDPM